VAPVSTGNRAAHRQAGGSGPRGAAPDVSVRINGKGLPASAQQDLRSVTVEDDVRALSMFALELHNWDTGRLRVTWSDSSLFAVGNEVEIWLGYVGELSMVLLGEITGLEPSFGTGQPPVLTVRGYDHGHRLARGTVTRTFVNMRDSDIARQLAGRAGLGAQVRTTAVVPGYVIQANQSDLEFLQQRAWRIGYEVYVREKVLHFQPSAAAAPPAEKLSLGQEITQFTARLSAQSQVDNVTVRGWNVREKKAVVAAARTGPAAGGRPSGPATAGRAFGKASEATTSLPVRTKAEADYVAQAAFSEMALTYVAGEVVASGRPRLRAGTVVDISGAGDTFGGSYYVTSVTHTVTPARGYQTSLTVQRNSA
jgi:phage protein D